MSNNTLDQFIELNRKQNDQQLKLLNRIADLNKQVDDMTGILLLICDAIKRASNDNVRLFRYLTAEESETLMVLLDKYGRKSDEK